MAQWYEPGSDGMCSRSDSRLIPPPIPESGAGNSNRSQHYIGLLLENGSLSQFETLSLTLQLRRGFLFYPTFSFDFTRSELVGPLFSTEAEGGGGGCGDGGDGGVWLAVAVRSPFLPSVPPFLPSLPPSLAPSPDLGSRRWRRRRRWTSNNRRRTRARLTGVARFAFSTT